MGVGAGGVRSNLLNRSTGMDRAEHAPTFGGGSVVFPILSGYILILELIALSDIAKEIRQVAVGNQVRCTHNVEIAVNNDA